MYRATPEERRAIADVMGQGWDVLDGRVVDRAAVVFIRPCSWQTIAGVRTRFPDARLVVVDSALGGSSYVAGPVRRALAAGADEYLGMTEGGAVPGPVHRASARVPGDPVHPAHARRRARPTGLRHSAD
jgi:hypothetical protein